MPWSLHGAVLLASAAAAVVQPPGGPPPAVVDVDPVRLEVVEQWGEVTGEIVALRRSVVASRQDGQVIEVLVEEGQAVVAGQVLARLDESLAALEVAQREAELVARASLAAVRRVELEKARRDWHRYEALGDRRAVAESEMDAARTAAELAETWLRSAEADEAAARAALNTARERLAQRTIHAPFAGRVARKMTEAGQWVGVGGAVVEIVALDELEVRLDVPEGVGAMLKPGESVARVRVPAMGLELESKVGQVMPLADVLSRLVPVRVTVKNEGEKLRPGMSVRGLVPTGERRATPTVHKDALMRDAAGEFVYVATGGVASPARVRTLFAVGERVAIEGGLAEGVLVVTQGNEGLFPGQPVMARRGAGPGSPPGGP